MPSEVAVSKPDWEIATACDVGLREYVRHLADLQGKPVVIDIDPKAIRYALAYLDLPSTKPGSLQLIASTTDRLNVRPLDHLITYGVTQVYGDSPEAIVTVALDGAASTRRDQHVGADLGRINGTVLHELQHVVDIHSTEAHVDVTDFCNHRRRLRRVMKVGSYIVGTLNAVIPNLELEYLTHDTSSIVHAAYIAAGAILAVLTTRKLLAQSDTAYSELDMEQLMHDIYEIRAVGASTHAGRLPNAVSVRSE